MGQDTISDIKERLDIVEVVGTYVKLQKSGVNFKAPCPFHNEKTGSFFVSPERQIWHCFGCGLGGDLFGFVKQIEGVEFPEALRMLATRAGVELTHSPEIRQLEGAKTRLYEITELSTKFFEKQLHESNTGKKVLAYLHDRGVTDESIKKFRLGYAPESWNVLMDFLQRKYSVKEIFDAGMTVKKENNMGYYDRFRSRIMFPISDINDRVVGFSARIFGSEENEGAKYINTPQTVIYDKSRILYGLNFAKMAIRQKNKCLVVEGNVDVIMSHQAGVEYVVASSGTALTDSHLKIIKRYTENLDLCFDSDNAGALATDRGVDLALARGFNVGIIAISEPTIKDPADYVKKFGIQWQAQTEKSEPFIQFYFRSAQKSFDINTALGKKQLTQKLMPFIASLASTVEKAHWMVELALILKLKEDIVYQELASYEARRAQIPSRLDDDKTSGALDARRDAESDNIDKRLQMLEESLMALCFKKPSLAEMIGPNQQFISQESAHLLEKIQKEDSSVGNQIIDQVVSTGDGDRNLRAEFAYLKSQQFWRDMGDAEITREFEQILATIRRHSINGQLERLEYDIKTAEKENNGELVKNLMMEFSKISKELGN